MKKVFVSNSGQATITCPICGFTKDIDVKKFKKTQKNPKIKCKCGEIFQVTLEFRKHYRKNVRLPGEYVIKESGQKEDIIIRDLSLGGIRFESLKPHQIMIDDVLEVKFKLDNEMRSEIRKLVTVKWIRDRIVGAQYCYPSQIDKDLGFYMRN
jgi:hypothetical protein